MENAITRKNLRLFESQEDSYLIKDYPWGFKLRTEQRVWVESKKGFGQRVVRQTKNPKTGQWCKPKKSTYHVIVGLYLDEKNHLTYTTLSSGGWSKEAQIVQFEEDYADTLTDFQKEQIQYIRATNIMNEVISYEIKPSEQVSLTKIMAGDPEECAKAERIKEGQQTEKEKQEILNKAFNYGMAKVKGQI